MRQALLVTLVAASLGLSTGHAAETGSPIGAWLDESKTAIIDIAPCGNRLCGRVAWLRDPVSPDGNGIKRDVHNPYSTLRARPICGLLLLSGFTTAAEPNTWENGTIYNPEDGVSYHSTMRLNADGTLRVRGYVGVALLGKSQLWTRPTEPQPQPPCTPNG